MNVQKNGVVFDFNAGTDQHVDTVCPDRPDYYFDRDRDQLCDSDTDYPVPPHVLRAVRRARGVARAARGRMAVGGAPLP